jgi:mono/diheme cytochrome c family protein
MKVQPHIRAYQASLPAPPPGTVTVQPPPGAPGPVTGTDAEAHGKVYYQYYCIFCHGEKGKGDGPVGQSYEPVPADLTSPRVGRMSDTQLQRVMLAGIGHQPALEQIVPHTARPFIVSYVRTLSKR